jgi:hypothetical protein
MANPNYRGPAATPSWESPAVTNPRSSPPNMLLAPDTSQQAVRQVANEWIDRRGWMNSNSMMLSIRSSTSVYQPSIGRGGQNRSNIMVFGDESGTAAQKFKCRRSGRLNRIQYPQANSILPLLTLEATVSTSSEAGFACTMSLIHDECLKRCILYRFSIHCRFPTEERSRILLHKCTTLLRHSQSLKSF